MGTQNWSEDSIIVKLPAEPQTSDELQAVASQAGASGVRYDGQRQVHRPFRAQLKN